MTFYNISSGLTPLDHSAALDLPAQTGPVVIIQAVLHVLNPTGTSLFGLFHFDLGRLGHDSPTAQLEQDGSDKFFHDLVLLVTLDTRPPWAVTLKRKRTFHPMRPRSHLFFRLSFFAALSGPPAPNPRITPGSRSQSLERIQTAPLATFGITFPGIPCRFSGFSFHRIPRLGSPPRFTDTRRVWSRACLPFAVWVGRFVRLGCSPARTQCRP